MQLVNIGFGNIVSADRIVAIVSPESATIKRMVQEEKDNKKKDCRLRSGAKKSTYFPKRKELASLKQLFVLNGNGGNFLYASPLNAGTYGTGGEDKHRFARWRLICSRVYVTKDKKKNTHPNERSDVASNVRPHFLSVKRRCFSER